MSHVFAKMEKAVETLVNAERELMEAEADYRNWRANEGMRLLQEDPKLAEWKVSHAIESNTDYLDHQRRLAKAKADYTAAASHFEALKIMAAK